MCHSAPPIRSECPGGRGCATGAVHGARPARCRYSRECRPASGIARDRHYRTSEDVARSQARLSRLARIRSSAFVGFVEQISASHPRRRPIAESARQSGGVDPCQIAVLRALPGVVEAFSIRRSVLRLRLQAHVRTGSRISEEYANRLLGVGASGVSDGRQTWLLGDRPGPVALADQSMVSGPADAGRPLEWRSWSRYGRYRRRFETTFGLCGRLGALEVSCERGARHAKFAVDARQVRFDGLDADEQ